MLSSKEAALPPGMPTNPAQFGRNTDRQERENGEITGATGPAAVARVYRPGYQVSLKRP